MCKISVQVRLIHECENILRMSASLLKKSYVYIRVISVGAISRLTCLRSMPYALPKRDTETKRISSRGLYLENTLMHAAK